jgi:hypothetical protein
MKRKENGQKRLKGALMGIVIASVLFVMAHVHLLDGRVINNAVSKARNSGIAHAQTTGDNAASASAFLTASQVFLHPRCVNCHPAGNAPLQGDESRPHAMNVKRGPEGQGTSGVRCSNCHQATNLPGVHMPPGGPGWQLPPKDMPMIFENKTPRELCLQLKDPAQNGDRTPKEVLEHVRTAPLVLWGWNPGEGRTLIPISHEVFVKNMAEWVEKGAACPE